ncbi:unnamed protein product [Leptosia nina]|uniref:Ommochrome-binding protein n=1 Tax=Leptosia nina TaxID=320188 RepID=A0AAV1K5M6_9NEOP
MRERNMLSTNVLKKQVMLEDVNVPYKFSIDRARNKLFFCINADEFCDQSFRSAILDLDTGVASVVPSIRNGFASAVDNENGAVFLGGSDGIFKYNYSSNDIDKSPIIGQVDVFDMKFKDYLYFIDTFNLDLYLLKDEKKLAVASIDDHGIQHFTFAGNYLILSNSNGLYYLDIENCEFGPVWFSNTVDNVRGLSTDINDVPYLVARDGIYSVHVDNMEVTKLISLDDGSALDFDKNNNMVYSEGRSVIKLHFKEDNI